MNNMIKKRLKYGDTDYYQSYKDNRTQFNDSEKQDNDDHTNEQFNQFLMR